MSTQSDRIATLVGDLACKVPVACASTTNIVLSGEQTVDGVVTNNSRVLLTGQTSSTANGIYLSNTGTWIRDADCDGPQQLTYGTLINVTGGSANVGFWYCTTTGKVVADGSMALTFALASTVLAVISAYMQTLLSKTSQAAYLTATGFSAFFQTLINSAGATALLNLLGITLGSAAGNVPVLDGSARFAAIDGSQLTNLPTSNGRNYIINGSLAVFQRVTPPTTDNAYCVDNWRLALGAANAATMVQDTADVPTLAKYAVKLIVGAGNNNKFGIFQPIEGVNIYSLRGQNVSVRVPLKATAGLTDGAGKIRIGILEWTGTEDAISATPISAWNGEGTNPTLVAGWAFANVPAAIAVTTAWVDYTVTGVAIGTNVTNMGLLIWSDDKANTQTTDILRIGGYVAMTIGSVAPVAGLVKSIAEELRDCMRWYEKTYEQATAPAAATAVGMAMYGVHISGSANGFIANFKVTKRADPTVVYYDSAGTSGKYSKRNAATYGNGLTATAVSVAQNSSIFDGDTGQSSGIPGMGHFTADASL